MIEREERGSLVGRLRARSGFGWAWRAASRLGRMGALEGGAGDAWKAGSGRGGGAANLAAAMGGGWRRGQRQVAEEERAGAEIEEGEG